jgi:hypothetical protein
MPAAYELKQISGHQQRWPRPLPGAILIPPALLLVADLPVIHSGLLFDRQSFPASHILTLHVRIIVLEHITLHMHSHWDRYKPISRISATSPLAATRSLHLIGRSMMVF